MTLFLCACGSPPPTPTPTAAPVATLPPVTSDPNPSSTPLPTVNPYPWTDENPTMSGICFEAAYDAAGQVFVLRSAEEHIRFYQLADESGLCRLPVTRQPFDFSNGRVLAGVWSVGMGCGALHEVTAIERDDLAQTFTVRLRLVVQGECRYELVRPFWIGLDGIAGYDVRLVVEG
ncbi:MAG: hypothetical protein SF123_14465 [Chloroflexota bacterium]|nr:hypothetical protein [Chloroflexota bacterium]